MDPNKKIGPAGVGSNGFITVDGTMIYTIYFENDPNATAGALKVRITDQLDDDLDWTTFELMEIAFGSHHIAIPPRLPHYDTRMTVRGWTYDDQAGWYEDDTLIMDINVDIDIATGMATWSLSASDPNTGWEPEDARMGFLPPDDHEDLTHRGEGHVTFRIKARPDLPDGTEITNEASIYFDANPPIVTPAVSNTIDNSAPASHILPLPATVWQNQFLVQWTGQDDAGGSGIASYDIYVSVDDGEYLLWLDHTTQTFALYEAEYGHSYSFYSIARDHVGHLELPPTAGQPDATTAVKLLSPDINGDNVVDIYDLHLFSREWLRNDCQESNSWCAKVDFNKSTQVDVADLAVLAGSWLKPTEP